MVHDTKTFNLPFVGLECVLNGFRPENFLENNLRVINPTKLANFGLKWVFLE